MASSIQKRPKQTYDRRLRELVRDTGDPGIVAEYGVPRSTAAGWLRGDCQAVVTADEVDKDHLELQAEIATLRWRNRKLIATVRLLVAFLRTVGIRLDRRQLPEGEGRTRLLREIERARRTLSLNIALRILRLSPARYHRWRQAEEVWAYRPSVLPTVFPNAADGR